MAGQPKKRARIEAEAQRAERIEQQLEQLGDIPDAGESQARARPPQQQLPPFTRRLHAVREPRPAAQPINTYTVAGPEVRKLQDRHQADHLNQLAHELRQCQSVRLERVKPSWCAGFLEDLMLESGQLSELLQYLKAEHGGELYRISVLNQAGHTVFESRLAVAGAPREEGRVIQRHRDATPNPAPVQAAAVTPSTAALDLFERAMTMFGGLMQQQSNQSTQRMQEIVSAENARNERLINALVTTREQERPPPAPPAPTLIDMVRDFATTRKTFERVASELTPPETSRTEESEDDMMQGAVKEAAKHFMTNVFLSQGGAGGKRVVSRAPDTQMPTGPRVHARVPVRMPARETPQNPGEMGEIVDV